VAALLRALPQISVSPSKDGLGLHEFYLPAEDWRRGGLRGPGQRIPLPPGLPVSLPLT
jgi:hypothetical protein